MKQPEETQEFVIKFDKIEPVLIYGVGDKHLRLLEKQFTVDLIARGNQLKIKGAQAEVEQVSHVINELEFILSKNKHLSIEDIESVIHIIKADFLSRQASDKKEILNATDEQDEIILYTKSGYVKARTGGQHRIVKAIKTHDLTVVIGPAGTGKTYIAIALAVDALKKKAVKKIVLARPAVEAGERLGYLPGDYKEKIDPYLRPLYDALEAMLPKELVKKYTEQSLIEVIPLAFMRGRTLNNAFVILDEAQNATSMQMKMFLTRLGINSKALINGDITQIDLPEKTTSGLLEIQNVLNNIEGLEFVYLDRMDVVRHRLVRDIIFAYNEYSKNNINDNPKGDGNDSNS